MEMSRVRSISRTDARIVVVRSSTTSQFIPAGMDALSDGSAALIISTVLNDVRAGVRRMMTGMLGLR